MFSHGMLHKAYTKTISLFTFALGFDFLGWVWAAWKWSERQQYKLWSPHDKRFGAEWTQTYTEQDTYFLWGGKHQPWLGNLSIYHAYTAFIIAH